MHNMYEKKTPNIYQQNNCFYKVIWQSDFVVWDIVYMAVSEQLWDKGFLWLETCCFLVPFI